MTDKLRNPPAVPRTEGAILNRLLYNNKIPAFHHYWLMKNLFQVFVKRQTAFN